MNIDSISGYEGIDWYDSTADLLQGTPSAATSEPWENNLKGVTDGTKLWAGAHHSDFVNVYELATGAHSQLPLEGFDTWTDGIGMLDGTLRVLDSGVANPDERIRVHSFDPGTGAHLGSVAVDDWGSAIIRGLWCGIP